MWRLKPSTEKKTNATWRDCEIRSNEIYLNRLTVAFGAKEQRRYANNNNLKTSIFAVCRPSLPSRSRFPDSVFFFAHFICFFVCVIDLTLE